MLRAYRFAYVFNWAYFRETVLPRIRYQDGTFRPGNRVTRGQLSRIIVLTAAIVDPSGWQLQSPPTGTFEDVPTGSTFYDYIETAYSHGIVNGYPCGISPAGDCAPPYNKPYFIPDNNATRAQISKIAYLAAAQVRSVEKHPAR